MRLGLAALIGATFTTPAIAHAAAIDPAAVFANAAPLQKAIIVALAAATLAGMVIAARKLTAGPSLAGGSAFIAGLRLGAPIAGVLGGAFAIFRLTLGVANVGEPVTLKVLAPGLAEAAALVALGFLCGMIAVALHWTIEARLDREILRG